MPKPLVEKIRKVLNPQENTPPDQVKIILEPAQQVVPKQLRLLESDKRLSECLIWQLQEDFYANMGISAWERIPYYATSNAFIGETYAKAIIAFLLDYYPYLNREQPVYIIEMAAGTGCFSFYALKELVKQKACFDCLKDIKLCYVITDFTENNLLYWESLTEFKPYIAQGLVEFALLKPEEYEDALYLTQSRHWLSSGDIANPVIAIANYFFDTIRQDYFRLDQGKLQEARITLYQETEGEDESAVTFEQLQKTEAFYEVSPQDYYPEPALNRLLAYYCNQLDQGSMIFPIGALHCLQNLQKFAKGNLMLISTDKGFADLAFMEGHREVPFFPHEKDGFGYHNGAFSYMVNYHVLDRYFQEQGGTSYTTEKQGYMLETLIGVSSTHADLRLDHLTYFWEETFKKKNIPLNLFNCRLIMQNEIETPMDHQQIYQQCLGLLEISNADPAYFLNCVEKMITCFESKQIYSFQRLLDLLEQVENNIYASTPNKRLVYIWLRQVYVHLNLTEKWADLNEKICRTFGRDGLTYHYWGIYEEKHERYKSAEHFFKKALALLPGLEASQTGLERVQKELSDSNWG